MKNISLFLLLVISLPACTENTEQAGASSASSAHRAGAEVPPHQSATPEQWELALKSTYEESQVEDKGDGIIKFMAKFHLPKGSASSLAFGERDAFRKLRFYQMGMPMQISTGVKVYISLKDNQRPVLFLQPYYWGHGWIFMEKIAVLVDGEVAIEHDCPHADRNVRGVGVEEQCDLILSTPEINALRQISESSKLSIRLTGQKGYVNVGRDGYNPLKDFSRDIQSGIAIYDLIDRVVKNKLPTTTNS